MTIENVNLPVGRIVSGNPAVSQNKTNFQTKQPIVGKDGHNVLEWRCEIAIPKDKFGPVYQQMVQEIGTMFSINPTTGQPDVGDDFSWKFIDGDSTATPKSSKVPYNKREGYPGHFVLKITTMSFSPSIYKYENNAYRQINDEEIKCGDYVVANINIKAHKDSNDGGIYLNPNGFELVGYGTSISSMSGSNPEEMFKQHQHQLPIGASATPIGGAPPMGVPVAQPPLNVVPPVVGIAPAASLPTPAHDFVQNITTPLPAAAAPAMGIPVAQPPLNVVPPVVGIAPAATTYPGNIVPGLPTSR